MKEAYLIDGLRTPIGSFAGALASVRADDMAAFVLAELVKRHPNLDPAAIEEVVLGCANQAGEDNRNVARMAVLLAKLPVSIPAETLNRLCASGLSAAIAAGRMLRTGDADIVLAGGVENMTRGPWVLSKSAVPFGRDVQMADTSFGWRFINPAMQSLHGTDAMGETAENVAALHGIDRESQDRFACLSQQKAAAAQQNGRLAAEIAPYPVAGRKGETTMFEKDEFVKPQTSAEGLARLKPAFRAGGTVTAGNASGLNDGAAALLLASETGLKTHGLAPLARLVSSGTAGVEPRTMGIGPVPASAIALKKAGLGIGDMDIIELNEAFAAQSLACIRAWGLADDDPRINPNGGAIALGHPLGMSGARILLAAALELRRKKLRRALVTLCVGVGQGVAVVMERA